MNYKEYKKALKAIENKYDKEIKNLQDEIDEVKRLKELKQISEREAWERDVRLAQILDSVKSKCKRSIERLKMNFARQDQPAQIGDIIWSTGRILKVTEIKLAAFDYPMLKYFGIQLSIYGLPKKVQLVQPRGGIYQKDIHSVNGDPYEYKVRE